MSWALPSGSTPLDWDKKEIESFINTGYAGASQLYDAYSFGEKDNTLRARGGVDISNVWAGFQSWLATQKKSKVDNEAYVKLKEDAPGRQSTVIGFNQEKQGTVLGTTQPYGKTVLG